MTREWNDAIAVEKNEPPPARDPLRRPPAEDPKRRKGPLGDPTPHEPTRRDPPRRGPEGEQKRIDDPKPPGQPTEIETAE